MLIHVGAGRAVNDQFRAIAESYKPSGLNRDMDSTLSVRPFEEADAALLTELLHDAYAELGAAGLNYTAVDQDVATTRDRALGGQCWVVEQEARIVGTLTMSLPPSAGLQELTAVARGEHRAWLNQVAVAPSLRGLGIAADLWRRGREWAAGQWLCQRLVAQGGRPDLAHPRWCLLKGCVRQAGWCALPDRVCSIARRTLITSSWSVFVAAASSTSSRIRRITD